MQKHAAIFLTHIEDERIFRSFQRLQQQAGSLIDMHLCMNDSAAPYRSKLARHRHSSTTDHDARDIMPVRVQQMVARGNGLIPGICDLAYVPAALSPSLAAYEYVWFIEYDVDFAGHWGTLFTSLHDSRADLLTTTLYPKADCPDWAHWLWLQTPSGLRDDQRIRCFAPIARFSRRFLQVYVEAINSLAWRGHHEALYPTIAKHSGLTIEDIGGSGPFTPPERRTRHYLNNPGKDGELRSGTFVFQPVQQFSYFHEAASEFKLRDLLYHPIKFKDH
jgi:hypothetical protein